jgi:hypothetical protein
MTLFQSGLGDIEVLRAGASAEALRSFFRERIREWRYPERCEECFTVGLFDDLALAISPATAFELLPVAMSISRDWFGSELLETALALVQCLARRSDTTKMPPGLIELLDEISVTQHQISRGAIDGITTWYRI